MAKFIVQYIPDTDEEDAVGVVFKIEDGPHISTVHRLMKQAVAAMGYTESNIEDWFGPTGFDD